MRIPQMTNRIAYIALFIGFFAFGSAQGQKSVFNPYSQLGIGLPINNPVTAMASMGGGYNAFRGNNYINFYNPASYSSYEYMQFQFGFELQSVTATRGGANRKAGLGYFNQIALGLPIIKNKLGMVLGYTPYTNVGYSFTNTQQVVGADTTVDVDYTYEGSGGTDRFMLGFGGNPVKGLSIGFNTYLYIGNLDRSKISYFPSTFGSANTQSINNIRILDFGFDFGGQYVFNFKDRRDSLTAKNQRSDRFRLTLGATYTLGKTMSAKKTSVVRYFTGTLLDDYYEQDTISERQKVKLQFPTTFGFGISFGQPDFWQIAADFDMSLWSQFRYDNQQSEPLFGNSYRTYLGAEITPRAKNQKNFLGQMTYRIGGRYGQSFLRPGGLPYQEAAICFGLGIPFLTNDAFTRPKRLASSLNVGLEYGVMMPSSPSYAREQTIRVVFSFNLRNKWFNTYKFQ